MKILEIKVMRGPNYWSVLHKNLIVLKVLTEETDQQNMAQLRTRVENDFPAASSDKDERSDLPAVVLKITRQLLGKSGMRSEYSQLVKGYTDTVNFIIYEYQVERAGIFAGEAAVDYVNAVILNNPFNVADAVESLQRISKRNTLGATTAYILNEVKKRKIPFRQFEQGSLITLGYGKRQCKIRTAVTDSTSGLGIEMAGDKEETKQILSGANFPVPRGILVYSKEELIERFSEVSYPIVVKPLDGNHGRGVTTNIRDIEKTLFGFEIAKKISDAVIVEEFIQGDDYRFLVINFKLVAVARRKPAQVKGDGVSTIRQLIERENLDPQRGDTQDHVLAQIKVDAITSKILSDLSLTLDSVPEAGRVIILKDTANISAGGTAEDVTDIVHPENKFMAERVARLFNLNICGVDIIATAVDQPFSRETGAIIEVNAGPGIRMHSNPQNGPARDVASPILDMLFKTPADAKIPVIAVTGTNGKTTTVRLIAHMSRLSGFTPGYSTTEGIYIDGHLVYKGDCTGYVSSLDVLFDPSIDLAVLECARGGILRSGLAFDSSDISIVTNLSEDHLGLKDIHTVEEMSKVKMVVPLTTRKTGYAILNADDDLVYNMKDHLDCQVALFSLDATNPRITAHCGSGGLVATIDNGFLTVMQGEWKLNLDKVDNIPLSLQGRAESMIKNLLPAVLTGVIMNFGVEQMREALFSFIPSPAITPGRMNIFAFNGYEVMVDYAHNVDGFQLLKKFVDRTKADRKIGIVAAPGDRRDEDIFKIGQLAGQTFDEIIIRHDKDARGRNNEELTKLLTDGIKSAKPGIPITTISSETEAIDHAVLNATKGTFITVCADRVSATLDYLNDVKARELRTQQSEAGL
jgi:cyanophycin synthetase